MPYEPLTDDEIRKQREANAEAEARQWSETKKSSRALLRERKQLAKDRWQGREVRLVHGQPSYNWSNPHSYPGHKRELRGKVEDVRIRGGMIVYFLDVKPRGIERMRLIEMEAV